MTRCALATSDDLLSGDRYRWKFLRNFFDLREDPYAENITRPQKRIVER